MPTRRQACQGLGAAAIAASWVVLSIVATGFEVVW